jgi:hypothetical protein
MIETETSLKPDGYIDPATFVAIVLLDSGFDIDDIDWDSISEFRKYGLERVDP